MNILEVNDTTLAQIVEDAFQKDAVDSQSITCVGPTYIVARRGGIKIYDSWRYETDIFSALRGFLNEGVSQKSFTNISKISSIEICLTYNYRQINPEDGDSIFANIQRGIRGIELGYKFTTVRYSPTKMIASNVTFTKILDTFLEDQSISIETFNQNDLVIKAFDARQVLITVNNSSTTAITMCRGNRLVLFKDMSRQMLLEMATTMGQWLFQQVQEDGRMTYKYWPSQGQESIGNNTIRQFMATVCMIRHAKFSGQAEHLSRATHNLDYNLTQFYRVDSEIGIIEYDNKAKLGAAALAALAILEHPQRDKYEESFQMLCRGIESLWQSDGSFRTFHKPKKRNDNQNFYPGEALLFWASLYKSNKDQKLLERCHKSFTYYREWHLKNRNPAFIPWHTQAYTLLFEMTGDTIFRDFIFEMNDWLLDIQQWDNVTYPDIQGRFYHPNKPYGPPHASSTGVYLEGLADAYRLAKENNDLERANAYKLVIWRGLRSIRQLQFKDEVDQFYISKRERTLGGVRTTVYDNTIRVDNVQHCLMAILKLYQMSDFDIDSSSQELSSFPEVVGDQILVTKVENSISSEQTIEELPSICEYNPSPNSIKITFVGDTYLGEFYQEKREKIGKKNILKSYGYDHSFAHLGKHLVTSDCLIINLECALTTLKESPFKGKKDYILKGNPASTINMLKRYKVAGAMLGNNHAMDYGVDGLKDTINNLEGAGITAFGAGKNILEGQKAFLRTFTVDGKEFKLAVISGYRYIEEYDKQYGYYTGKNSWGVNNINVNRLQEQVKQLKSQGYFVVVSPHWGNNYCYRNYEQTAMAEKIIRNCQADLIIGHGPHVMTEISKLYGVWVLYSIGNFIFNSEGEYAKYQLPPYSLIADLEVAFANGNVELFLHLYPIVNDNQQTNFQPRFVSKNEFTRICQLIQLNQYDSHFFAQNFTRHVIDNRYFLRKKIDLPESLKKNTSTALKDNIKIELVYFRLYKGCNLFANNSVAIGEVAIDQFCKSLIKDHLPEILEKLQSEYPLLKLTVKAEDFELENDLLVGKILGIISACLINIIDGNLPAIEPQLSMNEGIFFGVYYQYAPIASKIPLAVDLLNEILNVVLSNNSCSTKLSLDLEKFYEYAVKKTVVGHSRVILNAADKRNIPWFPLKHQQVLQSMQLGWGKYQHRLDLTRTSSTSYLACRLSHNKFATASLLRDIGIPVPLQRVVKDSKEAWTAAQEIGLPVVVKPLYGKKGRGISVNVNSYENIVIAVSVAKKINNSILIESYLLGDDHRILVIGGEVKAVAKRIAGHVIGDGKHSVEELLAILNADPRRGSKKESKIMEKIEINEDLKFMLRKQNLTLLSIPEEGETVWLRSVSNRSAGGSSIDLTEQIHPDNCQVAIRAAIQLGLDIAGIDFLIPDISKSWREVGGGICEVNDCPGLLPHFIAQGGEHRDYGMMILDHIFPPGVDGRIPLIGIVGTNSKQAGMATRNQFLNDQISIGYLNDEGLWMGKSYIQSLDENHQVNVHRILNDPFTCIALIEASCIDIIECGLGYDCCTVAVLTGLDEGFVDINFIAANIQSKGGKYLVVNADDEILMGEKPWSNSEVILVSSNPNSLAIEAHLKAGGTAYSMFNNKLTLLGQNYGIDVSDNLKNNTPALCGLVAWVLAKKEYDQQLELWNSWSAPSFRPKII